MTTTGATNRQENTVIDTDRLAALEAQAKAALPSGKADSKHNATDVLRLRRVANEVVPELVAEIRRLTSDIRHLTSDAASPEYDTVESVSEKFRLAGEAMRSAIDNMQANRQRNTNRG